MRLYDEEILPQDFHMPGIEPWISMMIKRYEPKTVLDLGIGMGFWGFLIKSYIARKLANSPLVVGLDLDVNKLHSLKKMNIYDELICADIQCLPFGSKIFDIVIAIESLYFRRSQKVLEDIENLAADGGAVIFSRGVGKEDRRSLLKKGYYIYHVYMRGLVLTRINDGESFFIINALKVLMPMIKLCYRLLPIKAKDYCIAVKQNKLGHLLEKQEAFLDL